MRPAAISTDASVTSRAKRSGRIAASAPRPRPLLSTAGAGAGASPDATATGGSPRWESISSSTRERASSTSAGGPRIRSPKLSVHEISSRESA